MKKILSLILCLSVVLLAAGAGFAGDYPSKPITLVCPYSAGGTHELGLRVFAEVAKKHFDQPIVVKAISGAAGVIGVNSVLKAKPDGYTMGSTSLGAMVTQHLVPPKKPFTMDESAALAGIWGAPCTIQVRKDAKWNNLKEFVEDAKKNPGKYRFGIFSPYGPYGLAGTGLILASGIKVHVIPLKGTKQAYQGLLSKDLDVTILSIGFAMKNPDQVKMLALLEGKRSDMSPDTPLAKEFGYDVQTGARAGLMTSAKVPADRLAYLREKTSATIQDPEFKEKLLKTTGMFASYLSHEDLWQLWLDSKTYFSSVLEDLKKQQKASDKMKKK